MIARQIFSLSLILMLCLPALHAFGQGAGDTAAPGAKAIVDKMLETSNTLGVKSGEVELTLLVEDRTGTKRIKRMQVQSKSIGDQGKTRVKLTAPKDVTGQSFLFSENKDAEDDVWMYLPAFGLTRRIEGSQKQGAFLGSHFSFSDLESRDIKKADYVKKEDETIGKTAVFVVEAVPKDTSSYKSMLLYVRQSDYMPMKFKFFGADATTPLKTIFVEKLDKTPSGQPYIKQMTLRPKDGGYTTIAVEKVAQNAELPDAIFSKDQLGK